MGSVSNKENNKKNKKFPSLSRGRRGFGVSPFFAFVFSFSDLVVVVLFAGKVKDSDLKVGNYIHRISLIGVIISH